MSARTQAIRPSQIDPGTEGRKRCAEVRANVLIFALWYWELDRGGPGRRAAGHDAAPDFLFPQMTDDRIEPPGWRPRFVDYVYVSLTNATAFSPTDTMPLTPMAKSVMGGQALVSLVTIGLIVARAVNVLN